MLLKHKWWALVGAIAVLVPSTALAATISWTTWLGGTVGQGEDGAANGTIGGLGVNVTYTGEMQGFVDDPWSPGATWTGGIVDNAPPNSGANPRDAIRLQGGNLILSPTSTITFSAPVIDPVIAIYSLGNPTFNAVFLFGDEPFAIQGTGGSSDGYGGTGLYTTGGGPPLSTCPAGAVCGNEGNGVVLFPGTYTQITWTNPNYEHYYAFTIGARAVGQAVPEPSTSLLVAGGMAILAWRRRH